MFKVNDKVFAKVKGHPFWPARINALPNDIEVPKGKLPIFFYGTHEVYFLTEKDLIPFEGNSDKFSNRKSKSFIKGMSEIQNNPNILLWNVDPKSEKFLSRFYHFKRNASSETREKINIQIMVKENSIDDFDHENLSSGESTPKMTYSPVHESKIPNFHVGDSVVPDSVISGLEIQEFRSSSGEIGFDFKDPEDSLDVDNLNLSWLKADNEPFQSQIQCETASIDSSSKKTIATLKHTTMDYFQSNIFEAASSSRGKISSSDSSSIDSTASSETFCATDSRSQSPFSDRKNSISSIESDSDPDFSKKPTPLKSPNSVEQTTPSIRVHKSKSVKKKSQKPSPLNKNNSTSSTKINIIQEDDDEKMEARFIVINREIKSSLIRNQENYQLCLNAMQELLTMQINLRVLVRIPELAETIRKCRRYTLSEQIKTTAEKIHNRFLELYSKASREELREIEIEQIRQNRIKMKLQAASNSTSSPVVSDSLKLYENDLKNPKTASIDETEKPKAAALDHVTETNNKAMPTELPKPHLNGGISQEVETKIPLPSSSTSNTPENITQFSYSVFSKIFNFLCNSDDASTPIPFAYQIVDSYDRRESDKLIENLEQKDISPRSLDARIAELILK